MEPMMEEVVTTSRRKRQARGRSRSRSRGRKRAATGIVTIGGVGKSSGFVDKTYTATVMTTTGSLTLLATIAQGTSTQERIGRKIALTSIQCRGHVYASTATGNAHTIGSMLIVYDKMPAASLPAITTILESVDPLALNEEAGFDRYKIITRKDFVIIGNQFAPDAGSLTAASAKKSFFYKTLGKNGLPSHFSGANGTIGEITKGALYLVLLSRDVDNTNGAPSFSGQFRVRFRDTLA